MGKVTDKGSVPPDDPMFFGGPRMFSPRPSSQSTKTSPSATGRATQSDSAHKLPPPPQRKDFKSQETFEEAMGYWQSHVGRIKGMAQRARSSASPQPSNSTADK